MANDRHAQVHPTFAALLNGITPLAHGPLEPEAVSYRDLIANLAERFPQGFASERELPMLSPAHIAAAIRYYPDVVLEALAHLDSTNSLICARLTDNQPLSHCYASIGILVVSAIRSYVGGLVVRDVQIEIERQRRADALEREGAAAEERAGVREGARS